MILSKEVKEMCFQARLDWDAAKGDTKGYFNHPYRKWGPCGELVLALCTGLPHELGVMKDWVKSSLGAGNDVGKQEAKCSPSSKIWLNRQSLMKYPDSKKIITMQAFELANGDAEILFRGWLFAGTAKIMKDDPRATYAKAVLFPNFQLIKMSNFPWWEIPGYAKKENPFNADVKRPEEPYGYAPDLQSCSQEGLPQQPYSKAPSYSEGRLGQISPRGSK